MGAGEAGLAETADGQRPTGIALLVALHAVRLGHEANEKLLNKINASGKLFLSHTTLNNKFTLRISISGLRTLEENVKDAQILIQDNLTELLS